MGGAMAGMHERIRSPDFFLGALPAGRVGVPEEIAGAAAHVAGLAAGTVAGARGGVA